MEKFHQYNTKHSYSQIFQDYRNAPHLLFLLEFQNQLFVHVQKIFNLDLLQNQTYLTNKLEYIK